MAWEKARVELRRLVRCELLGVKGWGGGRGGARTDVTLLVCRLPFALEFGALGLMLPLQGQLPHRAS